MAKKADGKLFLLQRYDNGDFSIYHWTPGLARKGYKVLTPEQAAPLQKLAANGKSNMQYVDNKKVKEELESGRIEGEEIEEDEETQAIVDTVANQETIKRAELIDESHKLSVTQDDILEKELEYIKKIAHKSTLEKHMLEKYQCEVPVGRLASMKSLATGMLTDLADTNRLYLIAGEITM